MARGERSLGDGDRCPINVEHGNMYVIPQTQRQWCAHTEHDGHPKSHSGGRLEPTRNFWPLGDKALAEAVAEWTTTSAQKESSDG